MNIYVGNLSFQLTETEFQEIFAAYGQVSSAKIIKDQYSGQSRGFGFIEMPNDAEGHAAIQALDGTEVGGRALKVSIARPREDNRRDTRPRRRNRW